ncbi:MAG: hypothetical protein ACFE8U_07635 [Candidatus Hermodarchaeota archaeon]
MKEKVTNTSWGSLFTKTLSKGCQQCINGEKLVVLVTSQCNSKCFYCPLSLERKNSPYAFANERPIKDAGDLILEASIMDAKGASMTGGDPVEKHSFSQTLGFCRILRDKFPKKFHIHLYTRGKELTLENISQLTPYVDEIRFHVKNLEKDFEKIELATHFAFDVGVEVPVIPTKSIDYYRKLITRFESLLPPSDQFYFINLNELEISETNYRNLLAHNLRCNHENLSAVEGSAKLGRKIVTWASKHSNIPIHFCSLTAKDSVQLPNRLYRIAMNIKLASDVVVSDGPDKGLLLRGVIQSKVTDLNHIRRVLITRFQIPEDLITHDIKRNRLLTNAALLDELKTHIKSLFSDISLGIAEEYPTYDELQTTFINL